MTYFDNYKTKMGVLGSTIRDGYINASVDFNNVTFEDSPSYKSVTIDTVAYDTKLVYDKVSTKSMLLFRPNVVVSIGKIAVIDSESWIISDFINKEIFPIATINKTNYTLKWKNEASQTISQVAIVENFRNQTDGIASGKVNTYGDNELYVTLPSNANTQKIIRNYRFIVGNDAYYVSKVDGYTLPGLIMLTLKEDQSNNVKDDLINGIADNSEIIYATSTIPLPSSNAHYIELSGSGLVKTNLTELFTATVYNNRIAVNEQVTWTIRNEDGTTNPLYITIVSSTTNTCTVKGVNNLTYIGKWSVLKATLTTDPTIFDEIRIQLISII